MSSVRLSNSQIRRLSGFGFQYFAQHDAYLVRPTHEDELAEWLNFARTSGRKVVLRGQGRSYGDASVLPEAIAIDLSLFNKLEMDPTTGVAVAEAGCTIADLWRTGLPHGWWPPVVSGTMFPSLGGALGMNIHGKNAYKVGTLGEHVLELEVMLVDGSTRTLTPHDPEFYGVISGAGQFAVILRCKLRMKRIESGFLDVEAIACQSWDDHFQAFEDSCPESDYAVSWVDAFCMKRGSFRRGLFHRASYRSDGKGLDLSDQELPSKVLGIIPKNQVWRALKRLNNPSWMARINAAKYYAGLLEAKRGMQRQSLVAFSFLLDYVPGWQRAYEPHGFIQYQSFIPRGDARYWMDLQFSIMDQQGITSFLSVLKQHRSDDFWFTHGVEGFSLAHDIKVTANNWRTIEETAWMMNENVLKVGGRFYLAKDSTLRPMDVPRWLGEERLAKIQALKSAWDPDYVLTSSLANGLHLFNPVR